MRKQEWTVRIVIHHDDRHERHTIEAERDAWWLGEALRYAGLSRKLAEFTAGGPREVFELQCRLPASYNTRVWAEQNAARLRSFGLNAVAAPMWDGGPLAE